MNLIYVTSESGHSVRINKDDLDDPQKQMLPIYNRNGIKFTDERTYNPRKHGGMTHIIRANIVGTPEYKESQQETAESFPMVKGKGAPQYTFLPAPETQLAMF